MLPEIDYSKDPQQAEPRGCDRLGNEVYAGEKIWEGTCGRFKCLERKDRYDPSNEVMAFLVENLGMDFIMEQLGYEKMVIE